MSRFTRGFTIVELLVSIAIIFILVTAVTVALTKARAAASRTETKSALRQIMTAYNGYSGEHKGMLLPGYLGNAGGDPGLNDVDELQLRAKLPHLLASGCPPAPVLSTDVLPAEDCRSYVWRLAPYLGNAWQTYMVDYRSPELDSQFQSGYDCGKYGPADPFPPNDLLHDIAMQPSIGLNSMFAGGDSRHGPLVVQQRSPWEGASLSNPNKVAAVRTSEVYKPSQLIIFAPCVQANMSELPDDNLTSNALGYASLRPPYLTFTPGTDGGDWSDRQWYIDANGGMLADPGADYSAGGGFLIDRVGSEVFRLQLLNPAGSTEARTPKSGDVVPVGQLDGSVGTYSPAEAVDLDNHPTTRRTIMSRWAP